jgi:hypothetical protein
MAISAYCPPTDIPEMIYGRAVLKKFIKEILFSGKVENREIEKEKQNSKLGGREALPYRKYQVIQP